MIKYDTYFQIALFERSISGWWNSSYKTGNENIKLEVECNRNGKQYVKRHKARFKRKQILSM